LSAKWYERIKSEENQLDILYKEHLGKLRIINAGLTFNTLLHRLESLCHQPKMNVASASRDIVPTAHGKIFQPGLRGSEA
jgi:hypothetical protein